MMVSELAVLQLPLLGQSSSCINLKFLSPYSSRVTSREQQGTNVQREIKLHKSTPEVLAAESSYLMVLSEVRSTMWGSSVSQGYQAACFSLSAGELLKNRSAMGTVLQCGAEAQGDTELTAGGRLGRSSSKPT